jgi:hypothetical protein
LSVPPLDESGSDDPLLVIHITSTLVQLARIVESVDHLAPNGMLALVERQPAAVVVGRFADAVGYLALLQERGHQLGGPR